MFSKTIFVFVLLAAPHFAFASASYGLFMVVKGDIKVIDAQNKSTAVRVGSKILPGETVTSGPDSRAKIVMSDRNVINISPGTTLKIEKYENNPKTGEKNVLINLQEGKARTNVEQKYDGEKSKFQIRTPTAVAGVRGTQFLVSFDPSSQLTQVVTLRGAVSFAPIDAPAGAQAVMVRKGETTSVAPGADAPEPPKVLPKEEIRRLDQETTASAAPPKPQEPKQAANGPNDPKNKDNAQGEGPNSGGPRNPAAVAEGGNAPAPGQPGAPPPPPGTTTSMIDGKDLDTSLVNQIQPPPSTVTSPTTALPPPPPLAPPPINPTIVDVIQKQYERTKVKIIPVVQ